MNTVATSMDKLKPGSLFLHDPVMQERALCLCLWTRPYLQLSDPTDTRVLVHFAYVRLGEPEFKIEERHWHDCNFVRVLE